jgi:hypothetical protein
MMGNRWTRYSAEREGKTTFPAGVASRREGCCSRSSICSRSVPLSLHLIRSNSSRILASVDGLAKMDIELICVPCSDNGHSCEREDNRARTPAR